MQLVFRPLVTWPRAKTKRPERSRFNSTWAATLNKLEFEVQAIREPRQRHLEVLLEVDAPASAMRLDGGLRADARVGFHGVIVSFESKYGPKSFPCDTFSEPNYSRGSAPQAWMDNVRAIALGLEALRKVDRYGITNTGEQYTGWAQLPPGTPMPAAKMTVEEAARFVAERGIGQRVFPETIALVIADPDRYIRQAAKVLHPDRGGDPALFAKLMEAKALLESAVPVG